MAVLQFPSPRPGAPFAGAGLATKLAESAGRRNIIERVKINLDEDEIRRLIDADDYYEAYLHSQQRDEKKFRELLLGPACGKESRSRERNSVQIAMHGGIDVSKM